MVKLATGHMEILMTKKDNSEGKVKSNEDKEPQRTNPRLQNWAPSKEQSLPL